MVFNDELFRPLDGLLNLYINYIKQLGLKDDLRLSRGFLMETLCPHEYDIPLGGILIVRTQFLGLF